MSESADGKIKTQSLSTAHWISSFLHVAAKMNLADQLAEGPKSIEELAHSTGAAAPSLYRMMRTLASLGLFTEDSEHRFSLTCLSEPLKAGSLSSVRSSVLTLAGEIFTKSLDHLPYSVQTGKTGFEKAL